MAECEDRKKDADKEDWKKDAEKSQNKYFEIFGSRCYDEIPKSNLFLLKKKVGFGTCGIPKELPSMSNYNTGYSEKQIQYITPVCDKIIEKSDSDPIRLACTILILHYKEQTSETTIFRIITSNGNIFIDACARTYRDWEQFMRTNTLPDCEYCYPLNGEYITDNKEMKVEFASSPASSLISKVIDCADTAGTVSSLAAAGLFATSLAVSVAPAALAAAGVTAACTAVYSGTRNVVALVDRKKHDQSIGLNDTESRSAWLNIGSSVICVGTGAAIGKAKKIVEGGKSLGNVAKYGLHALTATSVVFSGCGFIDTFVNCVDKYRQGTITKKDVFDLSCEMLFLFNALASAKATTNLVNSMAAASEGPVVQRKLTKTQKRNMRRRAAKRRAKGLPLSVVTEESATISEMITSTFLQGILIKAASVLKPKIERFLLICQSIGHDIKSWKEGKMSLEQLLLNLTSNFTELYTMIKDEYCEIKTEVVNFFKNLGKCKDKFFQWFSSSSEEHKSYFLSKVINMDDELSTLIIETEQDVMNMHEQLKVELPDCTNSDNVDDSNDNDLSSEAQSLLSKCEEVGLFSETFCQHLEDLGDVVNEAKHFIVNVYKEKMANYKKSFEAAESASGPTFDIKKYHQTLGIVGDVTQYYFNETVRSLSSDSSIYKIMNKLKLVKRERNMRSNLVWEMMTDNVYQFYGTRGAGLLKKEILSIVGRISQKDLEESSCKWLDDSDVVLIETKGDKDNPSLEIVVSYKLNEESTVFGVILIFK